LFWICVVGLAALSQGATLNERKTITVDATGSEDDFGKLLENNTMLFDPSLLVPVKRRFDIFNINVTDIHEALGGFNLANNTELLLPQFLKPAKRSVEDRATTDCGCGASPAAGRIVNGQEVSPMHSRPYQAFLQSCSSQGCAMCGATLINKKYALTAMHCVEGATNLVVSLGEHNIAGNIETIAPQTIRVERVIKRSDYNENDVNNDIAILKLSSDVVFNNNVVPACLPTDTRTYAGYNAYVSGWGTTSEGGSTSNVLKITEQTILANTDPVCTTGAGENPVRNSKMCAYRQGTDSCQGDSGGPLVVQEDGRWTIVGVVSYGIGCARPGFAGVYARVNNYLDWINQNVADGWCGTSNPSTPTTAPSPPPSSTTTGPTCDLTCTNVGSLTADVSLNGVPSKCTNGYCYGKDGTDLCSMFGNPCGQTTTTQAPTTTPQASPLTCSKPCYLKFALDPIRNQVTENIINVLAGSIPSICDMTSNFCCPTDFPNSDLCYRLGITG